MSNETHHYRVQVVPVASLTSADVLVGDSGGLSAVYETSPSYAMLGCQAVETEHGTLYLDADDEIVVLHRDGQV